MITAMEMITSDQNRIYKTCVKLGMKKYRDKFGMYLVEGSKLVDEAFKAGQAENIIVREDYHKQTDFPGVDTAFIMGKLYSKVAQTETSQGIMAIVRKPEMTAEAFLGRIDEGRGNVVVLDGLQDPGNIGTIIRTADAAGYSGVLTVKGTGDVYSPKVVRSAMGSLFRIPVFNTDTPETAAALLSRGGKKIVGTSLDAEKYYYEEDLSENIALVIGNEGNGMSEDFKRRTCLNIKIPMSGEVDSLNAAVAAGVLMYQSIGKVKKNG
ncbi:MAG: RNA methyltransferase [Eubacteriaceae bacterium]|jgi:TrmH family RNA methyltransferase|nr:RNA methyltransferase [Eubacteriaceae bacterium]